MTVNITENGMVLGHSFDEPMAQSVWASPPGVCRVSCGTSQVRALASTQYFSSVFYQFPFLLCLVALNTGPEAVRRLFKLKKESKANKSIFQT